MENFELIDSYETHGYPECEVDTYVVHNPHWNKRLEELDTGESSCFAPFKDFLDKHEKIYPDHLEIKKGLKTGRYYIRCLYF